MKRHILILFLNFSFFHLFSQENFEFDRYILKMFPQIYEGQDKIWDFSYSNPEKIPYGGKLKVKVNKNGDVTDIVCFDGRTVCYNFLKNNALYQQKVERLDLKLVYYDAKKMLQFPLLYGYAFENHLVCQKQDKSSKRDSFLFDEQVKIVGYGKLIIPAGRKYENVFLVKYDEQNFSFYAANIMFPIIEIIDNQAFFNDIDIADIEDFPHKISAIDDFQVSSHNTQFYITPNPVSTELFIFLEPGASNNEERLDIYDLNGKFVLSLPQHKSPSGTAINVSMLPSGTYFLKIGEEMQKFVKK